ncbi:hypothetical protein TWF102_006477, partial [Orbilia oligospora]
MVKLRVKLKMVKETIKMVMMMMMMMMMISSRKHSSSALLCKLCKLCPALPCHIWSAFAQEQATQPLVCNLNTSITYLYRYGTSST